MGWEYTGPSVTEDPVQREITRQKGLGKRNPTGGDVDPALEEQAQADYTRSQQEEPLSYQKPGETIGYGEQKPYTYVGPPVDESQKSTPLQSTGYRPDSLGNRVSSTYQSYRPSWGNVGTEDVPSDPLAIPGYMMSEAGKAGMNLLGEVAAPLQTARDYTFGAMTGQPGQPMNPRQVGDIFTPPGGNSTDWRQNIASGTTEGLAELAMPMGGGRFLNRTPKPSETLARKSTPSPVQELAPHVAGPDVLTPDAVLGPKEALPRSAQSVNPRVAKTAQPPIQPNPPTREQVGLKPEPIEPIVGQQPAQETAGLWKRWWDKEKYKWGQELPVIRTTPSSPVISGVEGHHVWVEGQLETLVKEPWAQSILKEYKGPQWEEMESQAVKIWKDGGKTGKSYQEALQKMPKPFQDMMARRDLMLSIENEIRARRGLSPIPRTEGPYIPRVTADDWKELRRVTGGGGMSSGGKQTVGTHQQERYYETTREGKAAGVEYKDPRAGWLSREYNGFNMQATDQLITGLEQAGVLHKTKALAEAASPTGKVMRVSGMPFEPEGGWWVRTEEEAQFLRQNFKPTKGGEMTRLANTYLRTPSLVNPFPHLMKNMLVKYGLTTSASKGQMRHLVPDVLEWKYKTDPTTLSRFNEVMPFTASGKNAFEIMQRELPKDIRGGVENTLGYMNRWSQNMIFANWDPALRYAKWKEYTRQGMTDQEAANHTWVDLIRYGTRSDRIDAWKALPANFFVPWRVGAIRTLKKSFDTAPMRTLAFVGIVDSIRELDYRTTGHWTHMPQDYLERPLTELAHGRGKGAIKTLIATTLAGPGGEYFLRSIETIVQDAQLKGDWKSMKTLFWGLSQIYDLGPEYKKLEETGDASHALNMLGLVLAGRHSAPYGAPPRFGELIPESLMTKDSSVKQAERKGEIARGERPKDPGMSIGGGMGMKPKKD